MNGLYKSTYPSFFAQAYGCDTYGENAYNTCATTTDSSSPSVNSQLADTGLTVGIFVVVAIVIMLPALVVRAWRQEKAKTSKTDVSGPDQSFDEHTKQK